MNRRIPFSYEQDKARALAYMKENSIANCLAHHMNIKNETVDISYLQLCLNRCQRVSLDKASIKSILKKMCRFGIAYGYQNGTYDLNDNLGKTIVKESDKQQIHNHPMYIEVRQSLRKNSRT